MRENHKPWEHGMLEFWKEKLLVLLIYASLSKAQVWYRAPQVQVGPLATSLVLGNFSRLWKFPHLTTPSSGLQIICRSVHCTMRVMSHWHWAPCALLIVWRDSTCHVQLVVSGYSSSLYFTLDLGPDDNLPSVSGNTISSPCPKVWVCVWQKSSVQAFLPCLTFPHRNRWRTHCENRDLTTYLQKCAL